MRIIIEIDEESSEQVVPAPALDTEQDGGPPASSLLQFVDARSATVEMATDDAPASDGGSPPAWLVRAVERAERDGQSQPGVAAPVTGPNGATVDTSDGGSAPVLDVDPE